MNASPIPGARRLAPCSLAMAIGVAVLAAPLARAEVVPGANVDVHFESAHIIGSGRNVNVHRLPVINPDNGRTTYYDASFRFSLVRGELVLALTSAARSPEPQRADSILPGVYQDTNRVCYEVAGPTLLDGGRTLYTINATVSGDGCYSNATAFRAQFLSGGPVGHPDIGSREIAPSLKTTYVYGYVATKPSFNNGGINAATWDANDLIGVRQSGRQLIIGNFTETGADFADPRQTAVLTRVGD